MKAVILPQAEPLVGICWAWRRPLRTTLCEIP